MQGCADDPTDALPTSFPFGTTVEMLSLTPHEHAGGILSDWLGRKVGMRGRLWWLFFVQMSGAVLCIILGIGPVERSLANSIGVMVVFSFFIEASISPRPSPHASPFLLLVSNSLCPSH